MWLFNNGGIPYHHPATCIHAAKWVQKLYRRKRGNTFCFQIRAGTISSWENYVFRVLKHSNNEFLQTTSKVQCKILRSWQRQVWIYQELCEFIFPSLPLAPVTEEWSAAHSLYPSILMWDGICPAPIYTEPSDKNSECPFCVSTCSGTAFKKPTKPKNSPLKPQQMQYSYKVSSFAS